MGQETSLQKSTTTKISWNSNVNGSKYSFGKKISSPQNKTAGKTQCGKTNDISNFDYTSDIGRRKSDQTFYNHSYYRSATGASNILEKSFSKASLKNSKTDSKIQNKIHLKSSIFKQKVNQIQFFNKIKNSVQECSRQRLNPMKSFNPINDSSQKLIKLSYFYQNLNLNQVIYVFKILLENYTQAYKKYYKVSISIEQCFVNCFGEIVIINKPIKILENSSVQTPEVVDYCYNIISVIYKLLQIICLLLDQNYYSEQQSQEFQQIYTDIVEIIYLCNDQTLNQKDREDRIYRKVIHKLNIFIESKQFRQNLLHKLIQFKKYYNDQQFSQNNGYLIHSAIVHSNQQYKLNKPLFHNFIPSQHNLNKPSQKQNFLSFSTQSHKNPSSLQYSHTLAPQYSLCISPYLSFQAPILKGLHNNNSIQSQKGNFIDGKISRKSKLELMAREVSDLTSMSSFKS